MEVLVFHLEGRLYLLDAIDMGLNGVMQAYLI